jgi:hypothetical protein
VPAVFDAYQLLELMKFFGRSGKKFENLKKSKKNSYFVLFFCVTHFSALSTSSSHLNAEN